MKKLVISIFVVFLFSTISNSQNQNSIWIFGDSAGIDFSNIQNPLPISSAMDGRGSCTAIADSNGNLILYSAVLGYLNTADWNTRIFNSQHQIIQGCTSISGGSWYNELVIVPRPNFANQFYVFSVGLNKPNNQGCYYTLVDMNLNGGLGAVVAQNIKINNQKSGDCIQAIKHGNGRDWWIINKYASPNAPNHYNRFFVYLVTPDSIYPPTTTDFNDATDADFQKMVFNSDGTRFMNFNATGYMSEFNFDRCTGVISLNKNIFAEATLPTDTFFWEGAFSPNDSVFYVSTNGIYKVDTIYLLQFNLFAPNIPASSDTLETILYPKVNGAVRLAPDGKIYFSRGYDNPFVFSYPYPDSMHNYINENLSVINNPNAIGAACNYTPFSFYLGGKRTYYGLPNNPNYELGPLQGSPCDTLQWVGTPKPPNGVLNAQITVNPNPTNKHVFFNAKNVKGKTALIQIRNALGEIIFYKNVSVINGGYVTQTIDVSLFCNGIYFISLLGENETTSMRFIKE